MTKIPSKLVKKEILVGEDEVLAFTANDMNRAYNEAVDQYNEFRDAVVEVLKEMKYDKNKRTWRVLGNLIQEIKGEQSG